MADLAEKCAKCGRQLAEPAPAPALCPKCELINSLLVERYTHHVRKPEGT